MVMGLFRRKKKKEEEEKKPVDNSAYDALGFEHDDPKAHGKKNVAFGIKAASRIHMSIFGLVGSGKSSILKLLILQNIQRGDGFMVVDPHGELARTILSIIPESRYDDVIYINPSSIYKYGRTVQINPLEVRNEEERYVVVMSFVNALFNLYKDSWGPRLETVLRNAANALVETKESNTLGDLTKMISSRSDRKHYLTEVASENVRHFWEEIFEKQYSKDAGSSAYNKMDKIMSTPAVAAMLDSVESSIQIDDIIKNKRMLIVDLSSGASDDVAEFIGTILLNMLYVEAKKRIDQELEMDDIQKNPFYVYVDEAHLFSNTTMSEMLRALRKFGIKMTIATQTINAYEKEFANEICGVCQTIVCGKCDHNTATAVKASMPITIDEIQDLQNHTFAFCSAESGVPVHGVFKSQPIPAPTQQVNDWRNVVRHSLVEWGEPVSIKKYMQQAVGRGIKLTPLDVAILHMLHFSDRDMTADEISDYVRMWFGDMKSKDIKASLVDRLVNTHRYVDEKHVKDDDGDGNLLNRYVVSTKARETYFSKAAGGRRAGSEYHLGTMFKIGDIQMRSGNYCKHDLGDTGQSLPDTIVLQPERYKSGEKWLPSTDRWDEKTAVAVEVETDPSKHPGQIHKNWKKNVDMGIYVFFVVFEDKHLDAIKKILDKEKAADRTYTVRVITKEMVRNSQNPKHFELPYLEDSKFLPECAPKHAQTSTDKTEPPDGSGGETTATTDGTQAGGPAGAKPETDTKMEQNSETKIKTATPSGEPATDPNPPDSGHTNDKDVKPEPAGSTKTTPDENATAINVKDGIPAKTEEPDGADTEPADGSAMTQDVRKDDDLGTCEMQHMGDLEYDIYCAIDEGLSIEPDAIRKRLNKKEYERDSNIREAINNLRKKRYVIMEHQTTKKRTESLRGKGPKKTYYRKTIMRKAELETNPDPPIGRAKVTPTGKADDTTRSKMATYSDADIEKMGVSKLNGLLRSYRTTQRQKQKIMEVLKAKGVVVEEMGPVLK